MSDLTQLESNGQRAGEQYQFQTLKREVASVVADALFTSPDYTAADFRATAGLSLTENGVSVPDRVDGDATIREDVKVRFDEVIESGLEAGLDESLLRAAVLGVVNPDILEPLRADGGVAVTETGDLVGCDAP